MVWCAPTSCSDSMIWRGEFGHFLKDGLPIVPSHEVAGVVVALGTEASSDKSSQATGGDRPLKVGDRVGSLPPKDFCGKCDECRAGRLKYCEGPRFLGLSDRNGGLSEYTIVDYRSVAVLPPALSFEASASLMCAGATIYTAIKECHLRPGQHVCILGAGALGHIGCQIAKVQGLRVSIIDARDAPLRMCETLPHKPDATFNSSGIDAKKEQDVAKVVQAIGGEPHATIVTTDAIPAFELATWITAKHGQMQVVGQPKDAIPISFFPLIFRDLKVTGSLIASQADLKELVDLVSDKGIEVKTRSFGIKEVPQLLVSCTTASH